MKCSSHHSTGFSPGLFVSLIAIMAVMVSVRAEAKAQIRVLNSAISKSAATGPSLDDIELDSDDAPAPKPKKSVVKRKPASAKPAAKAAVAPVAKPVAKKVSKPVSQPESLDEIELDTDDAASIAPVDDTVVSTTPVDKSELPKINAAIKTATAFEKKKDPASVITTLKPYVDRLPRHGILLLARAYGASGDNLGELHMRELLVAKNPKDYVAQTQVGDSLAKLKRTDDAIVAYQAAKAINKQYRPAYDGIWALLENAQDRYEARALLLDMVKVFGPTAKTSSALCRLYSTEDFLEKAAELCRAAIEMDPKNPDNYVHLGMSLRDQEQTDEASKVLSAAAKRFPASEWTQSTAGELKSLKKDFADAYRLYKQGTIADSKSVRSWVGLAKSAHELQKYDEAIGAFLEACKLDRKTSIHFRSASSDLRKNGNASWLQKYQDAELDCE